MALWHDAQRMQLERVHMQASLWDEMPVLIPASRVETGVPDTLPDLGLRPSEGARDVSEAAVATEAAA